VLRALGPADFPTAEHLSPWELWRKSGVKSRLSHNLSARGYHFVA
jgi:hypothetical protein